MSNKIQALLGSIVGGVLTQYRRSIVRLVKIEALTFYVQALKGARLGFIAWILASVCISLLVGGFVLIHVGLFLYLPWTTKAKACALVILGIIYFSAALAAILYVTSEKTWMKYAKVRELIVKAMDEP